MKRIGITGPTGAGKTTALQALTQLGSCVIDADQVYHDLLAHNTAMKEALVAQFGTGIVGGDGPIDRKALGNIVFADPDALARLNAITHQFVQQEIDAQIIRAQATGCPAAAIDAIALIESGMGAACDVVVGILAPKEVRIVRIMAREGISEEYARKRVEAQQPDNFYRTHCTHILENGEGTPEDFHRKALALFGTLIP